MKYIIQPYKMGSKSSRELSRALGCKRIQMKRQTYKGFSNHVVINWGSQVALEAHRRCHKVLNVPQAIGRASDKLKAFTAFTDSSVPTLSYTTSRNEAYRWQAEGYTVFSRTTLSGHSGSGIVVNKHDCEYIEPAPLYTKNFKKDKEFRVHVIHDRLIAIQQKRLKASENRENPDAEVDNYIWNHKSERVFVRNSIDYGEVDKDSMIQVAIDAVKALGLDFGSVDIGTRGSEIVVFEVNTASGLTGSTIEDYRKGFQDELETV